MPVPQVRQRPRRKSQDTTGMLSYHASSVPHCMHAEAGETTERSRGTRAATTFRNDPIASAGKKAMPAAARAIVLTRVAAGRVRLRVDVRVARSADRHVRDHRERLDGDVVAEV